jgi:hypothetical protein
LAPLPSEEPFEEDNNHGSARARANPDDAIHSFLNGEDFAKADPTSSGPPDGVTEEHLETFRQLADTFGRAPGAIITRATERSESDPLLVNLARSELVDLAPEIVGRALSAALRAAMSAQIRNNQDGTAGRGRGGMPSLHKYLLKVIRAERDDLLRARDVSEAKNRAERVVQEALLEKRVKGAGGAGSGNKRGSSWEDLAASVWGTTSTDEQGG